MWKKIIFSQIILMLVFSIGAAAESHPKTTIQLMTAPFGSVTYAMNQGWESLAYKRHPWLRLSTAEGPGCAGSVYGILAKPEEWKMRIGCTSNFIHILARRGVGNFREPFPDVSKKIKVLANIDFCAIGMVTLDPDIKTEQDLAGKRIGLGRIGQSGWALIQTLMMKEWADPPVPKFKIDYMGGPKKASQAMVDGVVDAACMMDLLSPDFKHLFHPTPMNDLLSMGHKPIWIEFTEKTVAKAKANEMEFIKIPANFLGGRQTKSLDFPYERAAWCCHKDFPEELAYEITKFMIENCGDLVNYHKMATPLANPANLCKGWPDNAFHPGALKAYKEAGLR